MTLLDDVRYALRSLAKSRAFATIAAVTLALGIGANTALFSVVDAVLLRPLGYDHPERIGVVWRTSPSSPEQPHAAGDFLDLLRETRSFEAAAASRGTTLDLVRGGGEPHRLETAEVTSRFFEVFGVAAARGRTLRSDTDRPGDSRVVLSHGAWHRVFGGDPSVVGAAVRLASRPTTVVGVMPPEFAWPSGVDAWVLAERAVPSSPVATGGDPEEHRGLSYLNVVARLRPGTTWADAGAELDALAVRLAEAFPENNRDKGYRIVPLHEQLTGRMRPSLLVLLGVVGLVLAIACANVAGLLLARGHDRRREMAVRTSLGASPARLVRQALAESLMLALVGGAVGLVLANRCTELLIALLPTDLPRTGGVGVDLRVLTFTLLVSAGTGLLFGAAPALMAARVPPVEALRAGGRGATGAGGRLRSVLVVAETALAVVVLSAAGLLLRSLVRLEQVDPGYLTDAVVAAPLPLPQTRYPAPPDQARFYGGVLERLAGRHRVAAGYPAPFGDGAQSAAPVRRENHPAPDADAMTLFATASPSYFDVLGIPLVAGRAFSDADEVGKPGVVVVSRAAAGKFWPGEDPLGQRVTLGSDALFTVVGIVGDVRRKGLDLPPEPMVYLSYRQFTLPFMTLFARGSEPAAVAADLRGAVRALDPELPVGTPETVAQLRARSLAEPRFRTTLLGLFALLGLTLAAVGLYGVVGEGVARRAREIGIRMALGAGRRDVLRLVLAGGVKLSVCGVVAGLLASLALGRVVASFLFGVGAADALTLAAVCLLLLAVSLVAAYVPARRASRLDPLAATRAE